MLNVVVSLLKTKGDNNSKPLFRTLINNIIMATIQEQREGAIKLLSNRRQNDKSSLHYIIRIVNHKRWFHSFIEWKSRNEWLEALIEEISTDEGLNKLLELNTFKQLKEC